MAYVLLEIVLQLAQRAAQEVDGAVGRVGGGCERFAWKFPNADQLRVSFTRERTLVRAVVVDEIAPKQHNHVVSR